MIRGMSYPKGIFYMDKDHIAHAMIDQNGDIQTKVLPFDFPGLVFFIKRTLFTIPLYFLIGMIGLFLWIALQPGYPLFWIPLAAFGYHFIFPYTLKQYHGAEHKVFSHQGLKTYRSLNEIRRCNIVNRHCSTNGVVIFYLLFLLGFYPLGGNGAALLGLAGVWLIPRWLIPLDTKVFFPISAFLQRTVTTIEPNEAQLKVALLSYISLIRKEPVSESILLEEIRQEEERKKEQLLKEERERVIRETEWVEI
ncbi:DUF1385 domain-containing protein [Ammoniphilus sp. CFH 90114]|uniref:DUF1385 domain-containing protein n=1 Tax=Ammoniphilus sp. CFH 90114 TaxID=2493665 RepID=UPI0013E93A2B|nr:DUF1385 domain-containing protein [Ammoniphilus sp. CFH 90114]